MRSKGLTVSLQNTFLTFENETKKETAKTNHRRTKSDCVCVPPRTPNGAESLDLNIASEHVDEQLEVYRTLFEVGPESPAWVWFQESPKNGPLALVETSNGQDENVSTIPSTRSSTISLLGENIEFSHAKVPRETDLRKEYDAQGPVTTVMLRNIPNRYTQRTIIEELHALHFYGTYDFLYLPIDKATGSNVGYVFINFVQPDDARRCMEVFSDYPWKRYQRFTKKLAKACAAHIQGLENNCRHYADRAVRESRYLQYRPLILPRNKSSSPLYGGEATSSTL